MERLSASLWKIACNRKAMDESIQMLKRAIQEARVEDKEKVRSLQGLGGLSQITQPIK